MSVQAPEVAQAFLASLPFSLTMAQERVLGEVLGDMSRAVPMSRLLQGDVGSGKTVVATTALLVAVACGAQGVLMAPTEVLAEQHYRTLSDLLGRNGREVAPGLFSLPSPLMGEDSPRRPESQSERVAPSPSGRGQGEDVAGRPIRLRLLLGA
jgi:ATP-dependent DNA helicase RecG